MQRCDTPWRSRAVRGVTVDEEVEVNYGSIYLGVATHKWHGRARQVVVAPYFEAAGAAALLQPLPHSLAVTRVKLTATMNLCTSPVPDVHVKTIRTNG